MGRALGLVLGLAVLASAGGVAYAEEPPRIVVVTGNGATMQTASSRNPDAISQPIGPAAAGAAVRRAPQPAVGGTAGAAADGATQPGAAATREQVGTMIRAAANTLPPETMGCLVQSVGDGVSQGLLPRDLRSLGPAEM